MSKGKFTSKELISQLRMCPQLAYEFSNEEVLKEIKHFLMFVGYELDEPNKSNELAVKPDFYAKRKESDITYEIAGMVRHDINEIIDGMTPLDTMKNQLGKKIDYVIATPPISERYLIDFMYEDNFKWYQKLLNENYLLWVCNPDERSVWCPFGAPRDKQIHDFFKFREYTNMLFVLPYRKEALQTRRGVWKVDIDF